VTEEVFMELESLRDALMSQLAQGHTVGETAEQTHGQTLRVIGNIEGLEQILNISYAENAERWSNETE